MTLQDAIKVVNELSPDELQELRAYIDQREWQIAPMQGLTPEERAQRLDEAVALFREGLTQEQLDEMTEAMNGKYIK